MSAILFGSIGTVVDTSELQRQSFNQAFAQHGLDWQWSRHEYIAMLKGNGGKKRIERYAQSLGQVVAADAIHHSKSEIFQQLLQAQSLQPRFGVVNIIKRARRENVKLAFVTTTSAQNVEAILKAMEKDLPADSFDLVVNRSHVREGKPSEACYLLALKQLEQVPEECVAIEDNVGGVQAAKGANLTCVAFPNQNTAHHEFVTADMLVHDLDFTQVQRLYTHRQSHRISVSV
ncbi:MAG: HAD-IA family hydrolase [Cyanobacteria bacterium J06649_4]